MPKSGCGLGIFVEPHINSNIMLLKFDNQLSPMLQRKIFRGSMVSGKTAEVFLSKQGTKSLNEYYQPYPTEIDIRKNQREDLKVVTFLVGLSSTYASTKEQLLTGTELPSLNVAFSSLSRIVVENEEPAEASRTQQ